MMSLWDFPGFQRLEKDEIIQELEAAGPGARGFVGTSSRAGGGHLFNAENVDGIVQFVDAQSSRLEVSHYFDRSERTRFARSDTLDTPAGKDLTKWVTVKRGAR